MVSTKRLFSFNQQVLVATIVGIVCGYFSIPFVINVAHIISHIFINLLKLLSLPIVFLSIVATISGMEDIHEMKLIGKKVLKYTFFTTFLAALIGVIMFKLLNPVATIIANKAAVPLETQGNYFAFLRNIIPDNMIQTLSDNSNIMGVVFIAMLLSFAIMTLPDENKTVLNHFFSSLFAAVLKIAHFIVLLMPLGVWAFVTLFATSLIAGIAHAKSIFLFTLCVLFANIIQGVIVLPLFLKFKKISPLRIFKGMFPALTIAFFSKSSSATLPTTIANAEHNLKISKRISRFVLPLCSVINMNGCAAFIVITVLFVGMSNGLIIGWPEMILWIFIATIAAVGNAGVPMGCYFLASALLTGMNVSLELMGIILPIYTVIDMVETALNIWSDACIASVVDKELAVTS